MLTVKTVQMLFVKIVLQNTEKRQKLTNLITKIYAKNISITRSEDWQLVQTKQYEQWNSNKGVITITTVFANA